MSITPRAWKQRKSPENGDWKVIAETVILSAIPLKQRKSPENGDWKMFFIEAQSVRIIWKQRKSPENGDWKITSGVWATTWVWRNKENLLKMEIESFCWRLIYVVRVFETKKISWKWRLKGITFKNNWFFMFLWNKENLLKMEIERSCCIGRIPIHVSETKKISWKWRLKEQWVIWRYNL